MLAALALGTAGELCLGADPGPANVPVPSGRSPAAQKAVPAARVAPVDINSAGRAELKTLPGIGDAEATRIIAGRPYLSKADLATREVIPTGMFLSLKNRIIAIQKQQPKAGD
ncbi:MAG TPA: helix-hairpin-helix domain-containing protein [Burkholderiaceae bacterium]|nr:helix-hairpin-helix domain-containing protein [Burkholderiaceae bacterium]